MKSGSFAHDAIRSIRVLVLLVLCTCATYEVALAQTSPNSTDDLAKTREMMGRIFQSVSVVLPLSLSPTKFEEVANREVITKALKDLSENAAGLEMHGKGKDQSFAFMSKSLAFDTKEIYQRFQQGKFNQARYLVQHVTENCIACHTRLPSKDSPRAEKFFETIDIATLSLPEKARLQTALRQFENAMTSYEQILLSKSQSSDEIGLADVPVDYLVVAVRVRYDLKRASETLEKFRQRGDLPLYLQHNVEQWSDSLKSLAKAKPKGTPIAQARSLIETGKHLMQFPVDRQAMVYNLVASSVLHRFLETQPAPPAKASAEAYYLLGLSESLTARSFWVSPTATYLESSIRMDPHGPFSHRAYELLEESIIFEYSGSSGVHLPGDVEQKLIELRQLMDKRSVSSKAPAKEKKK